MKRSDEFETGNNKVLFDTLRAKQLHRYIQPMKTLLKREKEHKVVLSKVSWKKLMSAVRYQSRRNIEQHLKAFLLQYGIITVQTTKIKPDKALVRDRVRKHREKLKKEGYRSITMQLPPDQFDYIRRAMKYSGSSSYADLFYHAVLSLYGPNL